MSTTSTVPAFKAALKTRLAAADGLTSVQVVRIDPYPLAPAQEFIVVSRARPEDALADSKFGGGQTTATTGLSREERYVVEVICRVQASRRVAAETIEERAYEIASYVQSSVDDWAREAPAFDGLVRVAVVVRTEDWSGMTDQDRETRVTIGIGVSARINTH